MTATTVKKSTSYLRQVMQRLRYTFITTRTLHNAFGVIIREERTKYSGWRTSLWNVLARLRHPCVRPGVASGDEVCAAMHLADIASTALWQQLLRVNPYNSANHLVAFSSLETILMTCLFRHDAPYHLAPAANLLSQTCNGYPRLAFSYRHAASQRPSSSSSSAYRPQGQ